MRSKRSWRGDLAATAIVTAAIFFPTGLLIALRLQGRIDWAWLYVLSPLWMAAWLAIFARLGRFTATSPFLCRLWRHDPVVEDGGCHRCGRVFRWPDR